VPGKLVGAERRVPELDGDGATLSLVHVGQVPRRTPPTPDQPGWAKGARGSFFPEHRELCCHDQTSLPAPGDPKYHAWRIYEIPHIRKR
jgi:hypothetical protein